MRKVDISIWGGSGYVLATVNGWTGTPGLGVHRALEPSAGSAWQITHLPTGMHVPRALGGEDTRPALFGTCKAALAACVRLSELVDWTQDVPLVRAALVDQHGAYREALQE